MDSILDEFDIRELSEVSCKDIKHDNHPAFFQLDDDSFLPQTQKNHQHLSQEYQQRMLVSEKLKINKLRKIQLQLQKEQERLNIMNKRRQRSQELDQFMKEKNLLSEIAKENNIKSHEQALQKRRNQNFVLKNNNHTKALEQKILKKRQKAIQIKSQYSSQIHKKNSEKLRKVRTNKQQMQSEQLQRLAQIHLGEWHRYQQKIKEKSPQKARNAPDYLYQKYKEKQNKLQEFARKKFRQQNKKQINENTKQNIQTKQLKAVKNKILNSKTGITKVELNKNNTQTSFNIKHKNNSSLPSLVASKRPLTNPEKNLRKINPIQKVHSVQYFGLYNTNSSKNVDTGVRKTITNENFTKIKNFIENEYFECNFNGLIQNQAFLNKFEEYLALEDQLTRNFLLTQD